MVVEISALERFAELKEEGKDPQLVLIDGKLSVYSYRPSWSEIPSYLISKIINYVAILMGRVDFDSGKIREHKESLRNRAVAYSFAYAEKSSRDVLEGLQKSIAALSAEKEDLQKKVEALEAKKNELIVETQKLDPQTKEGLEKKIEELKKELDKRISQFVYALGYSVRF